MDGPPRFEQCQPGLLRTSSDECQLEEYHVIRVFLSKKGRRVEVAIPREDMMNLKEVVGRDAEYLDQSFLRCKRSSDINPFPPVVWRSVHQMPCTGIAVGI